MAEKRMIDQVAQEELREMQLAFGIESQELLTEMEKALLALEDDPGAKHNFQSLFRTIHTIKGSASIVQYEPIEHFCHHIEHILVRIREEGLVFDKDLVVLLLACHDRIKIMVGHFSNSGPDSRSCLDQGDSSLLERLTAWSKNSMNPSRTAPPPVPAEDWAPERASFEEKESIIPPQEGNPEKEEPVSRSQIIRIEASKLDQLFNLIVELVTSASVLESSVKHLNDMHTLESTAHVVSLIKQIQEKSMVFRMVPAKTLFHRFRRVVHDYGQSCGKQIELLISGNDTELDKAVVEKLYDPLLHLVRNAIDHGIESTQRRIASGKPARGIVHLRASSDVGKVIIRVSDDGQGICLADIAQRASEMGLLDRGKSESNPDLLQHIFEPGFSTLHEATTLSGRGVGLDVVRKAIDSLRGRIEVETAEGVGTTFIIRIPISLSLVDGFMFTAGNTQYVLPMEQVMETLELSPHEGQKVRNSGCLFLRGQVLPCIDTRQIFGLPEIQGELRHIMVIRHLDDQIGLIVDSLHGEVKAVIKPLGLMFRNVKYVSGASILGDGSIALLLEMDSLIAADA